MKSILLLFMVVMGLILSACSNPTPTQSTSYTSSQPVLTAETPTTTTISSTLTVKTSPSPTTTIPTSSKVQLPLQIVSVTSPVLAGSNATLVAKTTPGANCIIAVYYSSGASEAQGLTAQPADANGDVSWTWKVGPNTQKGSYRIEVTASLGGQSGSQTVYFTVG